MKDVYLHDTTAVPDGSGGFDLAITDRWNTPLGKPNGGWVLAALLRATSDALDVGRPAVAAITYLASPEPGTTGQVSIEPVKLGRRVQTAETTLSSDGRALARLTTSFVRNHGGLSQELGAPPFLPDPSTLPDPRTMGMPTDGLFGRVEYRMAAMPGWATGQPTGDPTTEVWQRLDGGREIDWPALALLSDAAPPPVLELGQVASMTIQLTVHLHRLPQPGSWVASRFTTRHVVDGFHEEDGELWDQDGNLLAQSRQLAILLG